MTPIQCPVTRLTGSCRRLLPRADREGAMRTVARPNARRLAPLSPESFLPLRAKQINQHKHFNDDCEDRLTKQKQPRASISDHAGEEIQNRQDNDNATRPILEP